MYSFMVFYNYKFIWAF